MSLKWIFVEHLVWAEYLKRSYPFTSLPLHTREKHRYFISMGRICNDAQISPFAHWNKTWTMTSKLWGFPALRKIQTYLQTLRTSNSFHQQFAKQTSSAAVTSDLFVVWYPGLCSKCLLIHGSFSGNPEDPQKAHIQSKPEAVLKKISNLFDTLLSKKNYISS